MQGWNEDEMGENDDDEMTFYSYSKRNSVSRREQHIMCDEDTFLSAF